MRKNRKSRRKAANYLKSPRKLTKNDEKRLRPSNQPPSKWPPLLTGVGLRELAGHAITWIKENWLN